MPFFKSTYNILKDPTKDEVFNPNWMDSNKLVLPPCKKWDYKKKLELEDINIWEVIFSAGNGMGIYAAWDPYAEFYLITYPQFSINNNIETIYGKGSQKKIKKIIKKYNLPISFKKYWAENEDMWMYE